MVHRTVVPIALAISLAALVAVPFSLAQPADRPVAAARPDRDAAPPPPPGSNGPAQGKREAPRPREAFGEGMHEGDAGQPPVRLPRRGGLGPGPGGPGAGARGEGRPAGPGMPFVPRGPRRPMHPPMEDSDVTRMRIRIELIERMRETSFDPAAASIMALGAIQKDVRREKPEDLIKDLEDILAQTRTLGLRNAIRMTLKDLYRAVENDEKVLEHLKAMLLENDAEMLRKQKLQEAKAAAK